MVKMRATTNEREHQRTTEETDTVDKGGDLAITTTTAPTAKWPRDTKTVPINEMTAEIWDTAATEEKITGAAKGFRQENLENITHHQRIC
jgi:hypothetical protein